MYLSWRKWLQSRFLTNRTGSRARPAPQSLLNLLTLEERITPASGLTILPSGSPGEGYTVGQIRAAYGINSIPDFGNAAADGTGQTIAIVDAFNDPSIVSDLDNFDKEMTLTSGSQKTLFQQYGAASTFLSIFNQAGVNITTQSQNSSNSGNGVVPPVDTDDPPGDTWEVEESLDVEWAHAIAPGAKIDLVECNNEDNGLYTGEATAAKLPGVSVVSNSWGQAEISGEQELDSTFSASGVTFLVASGDSGAPADYPASSPNVVAVGGTSLYLNGDTYDSETGWSLFPPEQTIDNGSSSYSQTGTWTTFVSGGFNNGSYSTAAAGSSSSATWTVSSTDYADDSGSDGGIDVSATWTAAPTNANNATYSIYDGAVSPEDLLATVAVNQQAAPNGANVDGTEFQDLGIYYPESGKLTIVLNARSANGTVVADAIALSADGNGSSGGASAYELEPSYQDGVQTTGYRTTPDVAFDADPYTGVVIYDSYDFGSNANELIGGTSLSCPCWAGLIAIADQGRAAAGGPLFNSNSDPTQILDALYSLPAADYNKDLGGDNGTVNEPAEGIPDAANYNLITGLGSPIANLLIPDLIAYDLAPVVSGVSPDAGPLAGGENITITGTALGGATAVDFGPDNPGQIISDSDTQIVVKVPPGSSSVDVTVTTPSGTSPTSSADEFTYLAAPSVSSVSPTQGTNNGGTTVTIAGSNLADLTDLVSVDFGTDNPGTIVSDSGTQIVVTSPQAPQGTVNIVVTTLGGASSTSSADDFTYLNIPVITSVSPNAGPLVEGTTVTIDGSNLAGATSVDFGPGNPGSIVSDSATQLVVTDPAGGPGMVDIIVTTPTGGASSTSSADEFTYFAVPAVSSVSPDAGPLAGGATVTISGTDLNGATAVDFGVGNPATIVSDSATQIVVKEPFSSSPAMVDVLVTSPGGTSAVTELDEFTYVAVPAVTSVSPSSGTTAGGTSVTITGTTLGGATAVHFGNAAESIVSDSATQIVVTDVAGTAGTFFVTVTTAGGTSPDSPAAEFVLINPPTVTASMADLNANAASLVIHGANFSANAADDTVTFNNGATGVVAKATASTLTVTRLSGLITGTLTATVTTNSIGSTGAVSVATVLPVVTKSTAALGANSTSLTIAGFGFSSTSANDSVSFDHGVAGTVSSATADQLIVALTDPNGLALGSLTASVKVLGLSSGALTQVATVVPVVYPDPSNVLPATASTVTIDGLGFSTVAANDVVKFSDGATGKVTKATATTLTVTKLTGLIAGSLSASFTVSGESSGTAVQVGVVTPVITSVISKLGANASALTIHGVGFSKTVANDTVTFADGVNGMITSATSSTLTIKDLTGLTVGALSATVSSNSESSNTAQVATVIPVITSSKAALGVSAPSLTINGFGFDATAAGDLVTFGGGVTGTVSSAAANQLIVTFAVPSGLKLGSLTASAEVDGISSGAAVQVAAVTPVVTAATSNPLAANATTLTIDGFGFSTKASADVVTFSNGAKGKVIAATSMSLTVTGVSGLVAGDLLASVSVGGVSSGAEVEVATVSPVITPSLADLASTATQLVIHGFGFSGTAVNDTVTFTNGVTGVIAHATNNTLTVKDLTGLISGVLGAIVTSNGVSSGTADQNVATVTQQM